MVVSWPCSPTPLKSPGMQPSNRFWLSFDNIIPCECKLCNHNLYIGIIIFPDIDNNLQVTINFDKKETQKSEGTH